eukprot:scaffold1485_cov31-Tisochrysis_lutea.AAC.2
MSSSLGCWRWPPDVDTGVRKGRDDIIRLPEALCELSKVGNHVIGACGVPSLCVAASRVEKRRAHTCGFSEADVVGGRITDHEKFGTQFCAPTLRNRR